MKSHPEVDVGKGIPMGCLPKLSQLIGRLPGIHKAQGSILSTQEIMMRGCNFSNQSQDGQKRKVIL